LVWLEISYCFYLALGKEVQTTLASRIRSSSTEDTYSIASSRTTIISRRPQSFAISLCDLGLLVAGISRALAGAVALSASTRGILDLSNVTASTGLGNLLVTREDAEAHATALPVRSRVLVVEFAERGAVCTRGLIGRRTGNEDGGGAVLIVLAGLAASGGVLVGAFVLDAAVAIAIVGDAVKGSAAPALVCDTIRADKVSDRALRGLRDSGGGCARSLEDGLGTIMGDGSPRLGRGERDVLGRNSRDRRVSSDCRPVVGDRVGPAFGARVNIHSRRDWGARCRGAERRRRVVARINRGGVVDTPKWQKRSASSINKKKS
jgi:hypothetical protein